MDSHKSHIAIILAVTLTCSTSISASPRRWINPAGGMTSNEDNWDPPGNPDGDSLDFFVSPTPGAYKVYVDGPGPHGLLRAATLQVQDYVTFDLLGGWLEIDSQLSVAYTGGGGGALASRSLALTNNVPQRAELTAERADISELSVSSGVDVSIDMDVQPIHATVPMDLEVIGGGTMTIGRHLLLEDDFTGSTVRVSGPGSRLTVNGDLDLGSELGVGGYRICLEDQGVFTVVGDARGDADTAGIHLTNGILAVDMVDGRNIRGYGLVMLADYRKEVDPMLEIWNPMGHVSISEDITVTGHSTFFSVGAADFSGLAVLGADANLESPTGLKLIGGEIRSDPGVHGRASIRGDLDVENGVINVVSGDLSTDATTGYGVVIGTPQVLADVDGTVNLNRDLDIGANPAAVYSMGVADLGGTTTISGGTLTAANGLQLGGAATLSGHGTVAAAITAIPGSTIQASGGTLILGDAATYGGFVTEGILVVEAGAVMDLRSASFAALGPLTTLNGGTLLAPGGVVLGTGDNLVGTGAVDCKIAAGFGSTIAAAGNLALGDAAALDGFSSNGSLVVGAHVVTINDSNQAVLGSLTTIDGGELAAPNGLLLREGNNISGNGLISADVTTHGYTYGDPAGLELSGYVNGQGQFGGTVTFTGTYDPGSSPTIAHHQDSTFTETSTLQMEIGGTIAGSQFDKIIAEDLSLDGALQVTLIDGFVPQTGDSFDIFDFDTLSEARFDTILTPELTGRKTWDTSDIYTSGLISVVTMLAGDTDLDWDVDVDDYNNFMAVFGSAGDRRTDFNEDGAADLIDFALMRANFGVDLSGSPGVGDPNVSMPEPASAALLVLGLGAVIRRRKR